MNGIRSKPETSPPSQIAGQPQSRNLGFHYTGEEFQPQSYQSNYPPSTQYSVQPLGPAGSYDIGKPGFSAPRMPSPGLGQQAMYQQQPQPGVRQNTPFYPAGQQSMNMRHQRFPGGNASGLAYVHPPFVMYSNPNQMAGQQQLIMNQNMIQSQRMPNPQYSTGIPSNQTGLHYPVPPANIPYSSPGYGNQPLFMPPSQVTSNQRVQTAPTGQVQKPSRTILKIVDPNTGTDMTEEILKLPHSSESSETRSRSTPLSHNAEVRPSQSSNTGQHNEIAAQFAAQVAAKLSTTTGTTPANPSPPRMQTTQVAGGVPHQPPMGAGDEPPPQQQVPAVIQNIPPPFNQPAPPDATVFTQPPSQPPNIPELKTNTANENVTQSASLSNGAKVVKEVVSQSSNEVEGKIVNDTSSMNTKKTPATSESVTVSVKTSPYIDRTNTSSEGVVTSDKNSSKESTPEVNIMPPTPVEKQPDVEIPTKPVEPVAETVSVPKKQKAKNKFKELNKKGDMKSGNEYDAYTDLAVTSEEVIEEKTTKSDVDTDKNIVVVEEKPNTVIEKTTETEPEPVVPIDSKKEGSPEIVIDTVEDQLVEEEKHDRVPAQIEIKVDDVPQDVVDDDEFNNELEDGEILDSDDEGMSELRYKYSEDQWSPLNPEGKKHYDREFLLQFQNDINAVRKPAGLPDIPDIILDKPQSVGRQFSRDNQLSSREGNQDFDFTPKYVWSNTPGGGGGNKSRGGIPRQPSNQKNKSGPPPRHINLSISKDIELHKAKEAWKPSHNEKKEKEDTENTDELYKKTRSILNKLTPQKFQTLVSQMQSLPIDSESKLKGVIDLVFEKAISEPSFSVAYANMCRCLSMCKVQSSTKPGETVNFRAVLLTRCQREFEKDKSSEARFLEMRGEMEKAEGAKREELKQELEYEESKAKRRSLGNIRFIGELFKLKMLTDNIMHDCVFKLLRSKDPENLECLCRLLTTIGKELDTDKARPRIDQYFQQMNKIVNEKKTSSRVRFMLRDVIDLRLSKWVPRRVDNNPKTIDQIHKEVEQEAQEKALLSQQAQQQQRANRGTGGGGAGGRRPPNGPDGWNTVGGQRTPLKSVDRSIDPSKMKLSKQNVDESNIQLGPGGGASRFAGWGRGSTGGTSGRPSQEKEKPNAPANRFSALSRPDDSDTGRRYQGVSPARGEGRGRGGFMRPPSVGTRHSQEYDRERAGAVAAAKAIGSSQSVDGGHRERSRGRAPGDQDSRQPVQSKPEVKVLSADEMEKKSKAILDEYFAILDMKEALMCVQELSIQNHFQFVSNAMNHVLERSSQARKQTGHLLHDLVNKQIVSVDNYIKGLLEVLEFAEDLEIDIPKIWQYYGELISPMIQDNSVPLSFLKQAAQPLIANNKAGNLLAEILNDASHREGHKKVSQLWRSSGLLWTDFVPKNQVEQFLKDKKLEYTCEGDSEPTTPTSGLPISEIEEKLNDLIVVKKSDNEVVFDWIEMNVENPTTKSKFIRALMTAVCKSAIKGEKGKEKLEPKEFSNRNDLLQKYLDHRAESELQALYAVQALIVQLEHPSGVLRGMFETLYDEDIISEDAFFQWEKSEEEPEGKGSCLKQAVQFYTWLREAEDDS